jgi:hypothetical protein
MGSKQTKTNMGSKHKMAIKFGKTKALRDKTTCRANTSMTSKQANTSMTSKHDKQASKQKQHKHSKQAWQTKASDMASKYIHTKTTQANQANNAWRANTFRQSNISIASKNEHGELTQA